MISIMHVVDSHVENPWFNGFAEYHDRNRFRHVVTSIGPRCGMHDALAERGLHTHALGTGSRKQHPEAIWRLRRLLREERIDIVQTHQFDPSIIGLVAGGLARTPVKVVTRHHSDFTTLFNKPLHRRLDRWQALYADHVIAASHAVKRAMMIYEGVPESKIAVAQYGYDFDVLRPSLDENERHALRCDLDAADRLLLMTVSRLSIEKGLCYLVEAMQQVVAQRPDALLLILGPGPLEAELQRDIAERGLSEHVRLLGWRADARRLMQVADVMVHPTLHEAFCSVIIESMALERPLIATDVAAAPEQIDHKESGVLIPSRDPAAIAQSILELADDPARRRRLGIEARRRVVERFNFPKMMRVYEGLYEQWYAARRSGVPKPEFGNEVIGNEKTHAESVSVRQPIDAVSVIAPVRNEADGIVDLLNALARQTRTPDEIVIADGGSHDGTQQKIREWRLTSDIPLTLVEDADAYPGRGRNLAISAARHDWIASIDAGVDPPETWLESLITAAQSGCEQGIVYGRYAARTNSWFTSCAAIAYVGPSDQDRKFIANSLFHRSVWERAGGFPEELRSGEDLLFFKALDRAMVPTRFCRADPVVWEAQPTMARTFRRFALYSQHTIRAGLWREWHVRVGLQYAVMAALVVMGILAGWWWWLAAGGLVVARAMRRILAWHHSSPAPRRWAAALNPARLLTVIAINSVIDLAMVTGVVHWLLAGRTGANAAKRPTTGGSAEEQASPAHHQESALS